MINVKRTEKNEWDLDLLDCNWRRKGMFLKGIMEVKQYKRSSFNAVLLTDNSDMGLKILNVLSFDLEILLLGPY